MSNPYWVYLLECEGGSYYCGIALDVQARLKQHQAGNGVAYTRAHKPLRVFACQEYPSRSEALKAEYAIKQLPRSRKTAFFAGTDESPSGSSAQAPHPALA